MGKTPLSFKIFYALVAAYAGLLALVPFSPGIQRALMEKFHLTTPSFTTWAALQFAPSMYNFANQVWVTRELADKNLLIHRHLQDPVLSMWTNHYPFWPVSFNTQRHTLISDNIDRYIYLRTRFRGQEIWTIYRLSPYGHWARITP